MKKFFKGFSYPVELFLPKNEKFFLFFIIVCFISALVGVVAGPQIGMWVGFAFAAYAAVANDSIQTIGTFIASNQDKKWWVLWFFLGSIFIGTISYSWLTTDETGLTVFYPNEKSEIYTKIENTGDVTNWTKEDFKKLDSFLEDELQFNFLEENGKENIQLVSEKTFILDSLNEIHFNAKKIPVSNNIETYGSSFILIPSNIDNPLTSNNEIMIVPITGISHNTDSLATYAYGGNSLINYNLEQIAYTQTGKVFYSDGQIDGDVTSARLSAKGFEQPPKDFHFLHIAAPIFLLILTRLRMPVSTTFILLTSFATSTSAIGKVLAKSMSGYILAFAIGLFVFLIISKLAKNIL